MKIKKIIAAAAAAVCAVSVTALSASAVDVNMVIQDSASWTNQLSDKVDINADGDYTFTLSGLSIDPSTLNVLYVKDAACIESTPSGHSSGVDGITISCKSLKINGSEVALNGDDEEATDTNGVLDYCLYNIWAATETHFDAPASTIENVELTVTVSGMDGAAAPAAEAAAETPAADNATTSAGTGNVPAAAAASVMAVAGVAAIAVKKRK